MEIQNPENQNCNQGINPNYNNQNQPKIPPKTWLVESILATLFCCMPFGVVGIIFAAKVESSFYAGRIEESERASRDAKKWTLVSFWAGLVGGLLYLLLLALGVVSGVLSGY